MSFPGLDVVFRLAAPAVELLVQRSATAMAEVGDDEAGIGAVGTGLDAGDDAADPAPAAGGVMELLEAADLARGRRGLETAGGAFLEAADVALQGAGRGRGRGRSRGRSPRTSRALPGRRSGCRRGRGSPPAASWPGSRAPSGGEKP